MRIESQTRVFSVKSWKSKSQKKPLSLRAFIILWTAFKKVFQKRHKFENNKMKLNTVTVKFNKKR